jgi:hypothetical protein
MAINIQILHSNNNILPLDKIIILEMNEWINCVKNIHDLYSTWDIKSHSQNMIFACVVWVYFLPAYTHCDTPPSSLLDSKETKCVKE